MITVYFIFCIVTIGLVVGSFLNVCIYRIPRKISIVKGNQGRSMCASCGKTLKGYDLIPVLSYIFLGGKCRFCKKHISLRYPVIELVNGILWGLCAYIYGMEWRTAIYCIFCSILVTLAMIDWDTQEIPYRFQVMILALGVISLFFPGYLSIWERLLGVVVISVPMIVITLICNGFGGGDIQLMAVSGFLIGFKNNILAMLIGTILAGIFGFISIKKSKLKGKKSKMPFGPFLAMGLVVALFWGEQIYSWYFSFY